MLVRFIKTEAGARTLEFGLLSSLVAFASCIALLMVS
jgi:Flp pilus assembly pilin Flp